MLRRLKKDVYDQLPPLICHPPLELTDRELDSIYIFERGISEREAYLSPTFEKFSQLGDLAGLRRVTGLAKVAAIVRYVKDLLETVDKVMVMTWHRDVAAQLAEILKGENPVVHQGGMTDGQKDAVKFKFINDPSCRVFIGNITSAGTGMNGVQKVCGHMVFAEVDWVPLEQVIGRIDRMGQKYERCFIHIPVVPGTIEGAMIMSEVNKEAVGERMTRNEVLKDLI
jgi:hypothetical protein